MRGKEVGKREKNKKQKKPTHNPTGWCKLFPLLTTKHKGSLQVHFMDDYLNILIMFALWGNCMQKPLPFQFELRINWKGSSSGERKSKAQEHWCTVCGSKKWQLGIRQSSLLCDQLALPSMSPRDFTFYRLSFPLAATEAVHYAHLSRDPLHQPNGTGRISHPNKILQYTLKNYLQMYSSSEGIQWVSLYGATRYRKCIIPIQIQAYQEEAWKESSSQKHTQLLQKSWEGLIHQFMITADKTSSLWSSVHYKC